MSVSTKLFTALAVTALLAASLMAANLCGIGASLQLAATVAMILTLAWAFTLVLSLTNDLRRIGAACRKVDPGSPAALAGPAIDDDLAAIDAALTRNASRHQELTATPQARPRRTGRAKLRIVCPDRAIDRQNQRNLGNSFFDGSRHQNPGP